MKTSLKRIFTVLGSFALILTLSLGVGLAEETGADGFDLLGAINKLKTLIFSAITIIGLIVTAFGGLQFGLSFPSHDASQRSNGLMFIVGGLIVAGAPWLVNYLVG
ncbi:MAG: glutamyl-tRNA amidotransferase [Lachnospiraceae bacterium]|nr:glutamyl-tRNA amidotransferase [Lachnospiraceae bacterium]